MWVTRSDFRVATHNLKRSLHLLSAPKADSVLQGAVQLLNVGVHLHLGRLEDVHGGVVAILRRRWGEVDGELPRRASEKWETKAWRQGLLTVWAGAQRKALRNSSSRDEGLGTDRWPMTRETGYRQPGEHEASVVRTEPEPIKEINEWRGLQVGPLIKEASAEWRGQPWC